MPLIPVNGIEIEYEIFGSPSDPPLLLIMGLGGQMTMWDDEFCEGLQSEGHYVVRYDARDTGLSTRFDSAGVPDIPALMTAAATGQDLPEVPYLLSDMADDAAALLTELGIEAAHLVGASMGGMVAQCLAIQHTSRVLSMTSIMSTTGNPELPPPAPEAAARLMRAPAEGRQGYIDGMVETFRILNGDGFVYDEEASRAKAGRLYDRAFTPLGTTRHLAAVMASGSRKQALRSVRVPTLVIHGKADPLVPVDAGIDTHEAIADSELLLIEGMGHSMPAEVQPQLVQAITKLTQRN